jgi:hypothetical protein
MARVMPVLEADQNGGQVIVTRFECPSIPSMLAVRLLHSRLRLDVRREATGFLGVKMLLDWRHRTVVSISLWQNIESVYTIGNVGRHVFAVRAARRLRARTSCELYCSVGECKRVMFPHPIGTGPPPQSAEAGSRHPDHARGNPV